MSVAFLLQSPALLTGGRTALLLAGCGLGYTLLLAGNPARPSLRDGLRCLGRYRQLWTVPVAFGLAHAAWSLGVRIFESVSLPQAGPAFAPWPGWQEIDWPAAAARASLPTAEGTAGLFNTAVTTFPLSALAAVGFLLNWRGYAGTLGRALRRRFGLVRGGLAILALAGCAVCAVVKPALFLGGPLRLNAFVGAPVVLRVGAAVDWLGFIFEYALGVAVQVYLIALAFAWVRGLGFDGVSLRRFALRRGALVSQWALVVLVLSGLGINGPLAFVAAGAASPAGGGGDPVEAAGAAVVTAGAILRGTEIARWLLALVLVGFASVPITLVFHNFSRRRAIREHFRLLRAHGGHVGWFIVAAGVHFYGLALLDGVLRQALGGERTLAGTGWGFLHAGLWGALAGWLLASWVCLFRRLDTGRADARELVHF